jgi:hypothetical protein
MKFPKMKNEIFFQKNHPAGASMDRITAVTCGSLSRVGVVDQRMTTGSRGRKSPLME